jgi:thymidylate kinase
MELARAIDSLCASHVLVFGSLPPHGRDLDLLTQTSVEARSLKSALSEQGFIARGSSLVRFTDPSIEGVDVVEAAEWGLPGSEVQALFAESLPIDDLTHLVRPSPKHSLLILARRFARSGPHLANKHRDRIASALREDPDAWAHAGRMAKSWGASRSLDLLRAAYSRTATPTRRDLIAALTEEYRALGRSGAYLHAVRRAVKRPSGAIVALSGLDGAGKSTQAESLQQALEKIGFDAAVEWTKIARNPSLGLVRAPVNFLLRRSKGKTTAEQSEADVGSEAKRFRERSAFVTHGWTLIVALTNASTHRKATKRHLRDGRVVICDRYILDSAAHLRYRYGPDRKFRLQRALVRWLSPKPRHQLLLQVPPDVALERKAEQYDLEQLTLLARLYTEERIALGIQEIDGTEPPQELSARIAQEVWERLTT